MRLASHLKNAVVPPGRGPRRILTGPFKGIVMDLCLRTQMQLYLGLFEKETYAWLTRLSNGIVTAIDIGVAYGEYTLYFLTKTQASRVFAFEPDMTLFPYLYKNLKLNDLDRSEKLEIFHKFLGMSDSEKVIRLDSIANLIQAPCFIKMDVDGAEEEILAGANKINDLPDMRWLIETHSKDLEVACEKSLRASGFQTRIIPNAAWRVFVPEQRPIEQNRWLAAWRT
jgi:hypothetical protein